MPGTITSRDGLHTEKGPLLSCLLTAAVVDRRSQTKKPEAEKDELQSQERSQHVTISMLRVGHCRFLSHLSKLNLSHTSQGHTSHTSPS